LPRAWHQTTGLAVADQLVRAFSGGVEQGTYTEKFVTP
jgi:hypothetical protein